MDYKIENLNDTVTLMNSSDYKERFKAEYLQTKIRYDKLHKMCIKYEANTLNFEPKCSLELLKEQKSYMENYLRTLEVRAEIEQIDLSDSTNKMTESELHLLDTIEEDIRNSNISEEHKKAMTKAFNILSSNS